MKQEETNKFIKSKEYRSMDLWNQLLNESYVLIAENVNLDHVYDYKSKGKNWWEFKGGRDIQHEIRLVYSPDLDNKELSVKFYWIKDNKPNYEKPPYTDERVFNTHIKILIEEILPKLSEYFRTFNIDKLTLDPTDSSRYRLYRIALNQVLDKSKYELVENSSNNLLYIKIK